MTQPITACEASETVVYVLLKINGTNQNLDPVVYELLRIKHAFSLIIYQADGCLD